MKRFGDMTIEELEGVVNRSKELREKLDNFIQDTESYWLDERLSCVWDSLEKWSVGFYEPSYIKVSDWKGFLEGVKKCEKAFGCSERVRKKIAQCEKLWWCNLFEHHVKILKEMWYEDEIKSTIDYVEAAGLELYDGAVGEKSRNYLEDFFMNYGLEDYLYDEENGIFYKPIKLSA